MSFKIPLRNTNKDIIAYTTVSECDFEFLNKFKWHKNKEGYAKGNPSLIHRYIYILVYVFIKKVINGKQIFM